MKRIMLTGMAMGRNQRSATLDDADYYRLAPYRWYWKDSNGGVVRDHYEPDGKRRYIRMLDAVAEGGPPLFFTGADRLDFRREVLTDDPAKAAKRVKQGGVVVVSRGPSPEESREMARLIAEELWQLAAQGGERDAAE